MNMRDTQDVVRWRTDFPILESHVHERPLVYLDNAATTQKPYDVIEAEARYYRHDNANVHRGVHTLSQRATEDYEAARGKVQRFINAASPSEIIFLRGTTEAINLVAQSYGRSRLREGDEIVISAMEHHSNIVPWQMLCQQTGVRLKVIPINDAGEIQLDAYQRLLGPRTRLVAVSHVSNALGTVNPVQTMIELAHEIDVPVLLDGAQAIAHVPVDVQALDCDFYAFSGHKIYGPMGIGVLYGKTELLNTMPPYQGGGDMIRSVTFEHTEYNVLPFKFEAGTPNVAGAVGLGAALDYVGNIGMETIMAHEQNVLEHATSLVSSIPGIRLIGTAREKTGILSFVMHEAHAHDVGTILDRQGIAIRSGHHCAMPIMDRYGVPATARASFALYNTRFEAELLAAGLEKVIELFNG
ncbi:cysteine desulfurase / selenocysteine lyase [Novimethylophilus kurashikiensis]|uniref:Cysteine desulfurase n=1 Tax=Novimethylophilus kurashikiensis TaxID=1825523 RepID=A0A2R5F4N6_9PROT|nr:cysteine desulfurase [Novimethylophilus kurashikiensis]GBG12688.1 cysteine desulfurase / selenocysteine lyase [Novimethylophilus kurashikiensis]